MPAGGYFGRALVVDVDRRERRGAAARRRRPARLRRRRRAGHVAACTGSRRRASTRSAPEAPLAFCFSPLVGTPLTTSAKFAVVAKSPLTGLLNDALASSHFAIAGKLTGHDAIVVRGACDEPSVLLVDGDGAAAGAGRRPLGPARPPRPRRACASGSARRGASPSIGPAGRAAGPVRHALARRPPRRPRRARRGARRRSCSRPSRCGRRRRSRPPTRRRVLAAARDLRARSFGPATAKYRELGTLANLLAFNAIATLPTRNFQAATFAEAPRLVRRGPRRGARRRARQLRLVLDRLRAHLQDAAGGKQTRGWSTRTCSPSARCAGSSTPTPCSRRARRCDELGLDTISAGGTIALAMECAERGLIDAPWLRFGDGGGAAARDRARSARARGSATLLAEGSRGAPPQVVGQGSAAFAAARQGAGAARLRAAHAAGDGARARGRRPRRRPQPLRRLRGRPVRRPRPARRRRRRTSRPRSRPRTARR